MRTLLLSMIALAACGDGSSAVQAAPRPINPGDFLRRAMAEGLKEDAADRALLKEVFVTAKGDLFVLKCPVCEPVKLGLAEYLNARPAEAPAAPAEGKGLPKDIADDLKDPARIKVLRALERLVDRYVSRHYERLAMTGEERETMRAALATMRKEGMRMKQRGPQKDFGDFCPSCDGAAKAK